MAHDPFLEAAALLNQPFSVPLLIDLGLFVDALIC
jgi:hypothetical protein